MSTSWMILLIALWVVVAVLIALVLGMNRRIQALAERPGPESEHAHRGTPINIGGPSLGSRFDLWAEIGSKTPSSVDAVRGQLVLFLNTGCGPCRALGEQLVGSQAVAHVFAGVCPILVTDERGRATYAELPVTEVLVQYDDEISRQLKVNATPFAIATDASGVVRWSGIPQSAEDVLMMAAACGDVRNGHHAPIPAA